MGAPGSARGNGVSRAALEAEMARRLAEWGADSAKNVRERVTLRLASFSEHQIGRFLARLASTGGDWGYHPPDPVGRALFRDLLAVVLEPDSRIENPEALGVANERPVVLLGNHLSYADANAFEYLMVRAGLPEPAENLTTLVGPKVFSDPIRRLASLCFGTIKLPQSPSRASGEALMKAREVARLARRAIDTARARYALGEHLLVFPEGSRSRSGGLERCLAAVVRYCEAENCTIVPWGHIGCERLFPVGEAHVERATVRIRVGPAVAAAPLIERCRHRRQRVADAVGFLIADLLPPGYRGVYGKPRAELAPAREIVDELVL